MKLALGKRTIIIACLILSGLMIIDSLNIGHSLTMLLIAGIIPGTNIAIDATRMLELYLVIVGFIAARITNHVALRVLNAYQLRHPFTPRTS